MRTANESSASHSSHNLFKFYDCGSCMPPLRSLTNSAIIKKLFSMIFVHIPMMCEMLCIGAEVGGMFLFEGYFTSRLV